MKAIKTTTETTARQKAVRIINDSMEEAMGMIRRAEAFLDERGPEEYYQREQLYYHIEAEKRMENLNALLADPTDFRAKRESVAKLAAYRRLSYNAVQTMRDAAEHNAKAELLAVLDYIIDELGDEA